MYLEVKYQNSCQGNPADLSTQGQNCLAIIFFNVGLAVRIKEKDEKETAS